MENFKNLPDEIRLAILTRLPAKSCLQCKSVCKTWKYLISLPVFAKMHLNRLNDSGELSFLIRSWKLSFLLAPSEYYSFDYTEKNSFCRRNNIIRQDTSYAIVGSCNGLICLFNHDDTIVISNPIIGENVMLPKITPHAHRDKNLFSGYMYCGFGYLPKTDKYKVVRLYTLLEESKFLEVEVYTLGSGSGWRKMGKLEHSGYVGHKGIFAHGAIYWLFSSTIVAFDLADEKFRDIPLPSTMARNNFKLLGLGFNIWPLGDYLMLVHDNTIEDVNIGRWLLKIKDGFSELDCNWVSGTEEFSFNDIRMQPFAFTNCGAVLCIKRLIGHTTLHRYEQKYSSLEMLAEADQQFCGFPVPHMNTLLSMKALGEKTDHEQAVRIGKIPEEYRCKLKVGDAL